MLGKFQMLEFQSWRGLTKETHIGAMYRKSPQKFSNIMVQLLATNRGKSLETYLSKLPVKYFDTADEYTWDIIGSSRRNIPIIEARDLDGVVITSGNAGANGEAFYAVFGEDWFADGEVIVGEKNEVYPLRILGEPRREGTNAVYKVELMGGVLDGMPAEELALGKRFSWDYAVVERTMSRGVGGVRYTTPVAMRNEWSTVRIQEKVPGDMLNRKLSVGFPVVTKNGEKKVHDVWMHYVDYQVEETFSEYKNNIIMYGRSNRNTNGEYLNIGKSGNVIRQGAGLLEQREVANTEYYNEFSLTRLENILSELSTTKLDFKNRHFILKTGERGAIQFHKAVLNVTSGWSAFNYLGGNAANPAIIHKTSSELHTNALSAGFQFTEYRAPNGVIVTIDVDPLYDDPVRNKIQHPRGGVAYSYRYDIYDIGTMDQPNIQLCKIRGEEEIRGYQWGLRNPFTGQKDNFNMSFDEDAAIIHKMATLGVVVLDPSRTLSLIPSQLA